MSKERAKRGTDNDRRRQREKDEEKKKNAYDNIVSNENDKNQNIEKRRNRLQNNIRILGKK